MKEIYLLRHAKSSWAGQSQGDHERPLNQRGRQAATALEAYLVTHAVEPSLVLCSSAARTVETLERIAPALGSSTHVEIDPELYLASGPLMLARIVAVDDTVESVMLIGHNPGMHELALALGSEGPERDRFVAKLPTGALVCLALDVPTWSDVAPGGGRITDVVFPREIA